MSDKEVRIRITGDVSDLEKKLKSIESSLKDLGKSNTGNNKFVNSLIDDIDKADKKIDELGDSLDDMSDSFRTAGKNNGLDDMVSDISKVNKELSVTTDGFKDLGKGITSIDSKKLESFSQAMKEVAAEREDIEKVTKSLNDMDDMKNLKTANLDFGGVKKSTEAIMKKSDNMLSDIATGFVSGTVAGKVMANTVGDVTAGLKDAVAALDALGDNTSFANKVKAFDNFAEQLDKTRKYVEELKKEVADLESQRGNIRSNKDGIVGNIDDIKEEIEYMERLKKALNELDECDFHYNDLLGGNERSIHGINEEINNLEDFIKTCKEAQKLGKKTMDDYYESVRQPGDGIDFLDFEDDLRSPIAALKESQKELEQLLEFRKRILKEIEQDYDVDLSDRDGLLKNTTNLGHAKKFVKEYEEYAEMLKDFNKYREEIAESSIWKPINNPDYGDNMPLNEKNAKKMLNSYRDIYLEYKKMVEEMSGSKGMWDDGDDEHLADLRKQLKEYNSELKETRSAEADISDITEKLAIKRRELAEAQKELNIAEDKEQSYADEFNKKLEAYDKLEKEILDYIQSSDKSELAQKRVALAYKELSESMARMYDDIDTDTANKALLDLEESLSGVIKELKIDSTANLFEDLEKLGKSIEDKTDKLKEFKEASRDIGDDKEAKRLLAQSNALREYADNAAYALKVVKEYEDGTQDVAIVGNKKALEDFLDTKKIKEYNEAINEYLHLMNETGGQISKRFLDDDGKFDVNKYIADYERFGKPITQLTANFKALRQQVLEYLKVQNEIDDIKADMAVTKMYKEEAEAAQKAAKARVEAAQAAYDAAEAEMKLSGEQQDAIARGIKLSGVLGELKEAQKELADANKDVEKYTQELADAQKDLADAQERASKAEKEGIADKAEAVRQINEQAQALRKLGAAVDDIELDEIRDIDKVLGTKLKDLFSNGLPKSFGEIGEYIKAAFSELNDLDFGNFGSLLKDAGSGLLKNIFAKLPAEAKIAAAAIAAVTVALNKLYESGKRQFFDGLSNAAQKLQPIINAFQSFGREAITAFESITGTNIDLSSLMEIGPNFEYQMQKVGTIAGSNTRQLEELTKRAESLGGSTMYTATQVGQAFEYMAMAGYSTEEMLSSINGVVSLSIASGTDLAKTSDIVTDYMTAMGMSASNTSDFVDKLAATVTSANTTVELFGTSMKQVGSQAGSLGITMTDISTAIGLAANAGVKGSKAGTALKNVLANMASPTEKQADALEKLGFKADEAGSYLITTSDGAVDLEANMKKLMTATEGMSRSERAAALTAIAGKEAMAGLFAIVNQGTEAWDELSSTIENSTGTVQYWNECMSLAGKSGEEATKTIDNMKKIFSETESEAIDLGLSTKDLSHAIAILGDDGDVTTQNVRDLISVIENMNTASGEAEEQWRSLDKTGKNAINTNYDYDATLAKIAADTTGLSQEKKELIKSQLDENMTFEQANAVLEKYGMSAEKVSFSTLTYADKLGYLRDTLGDTLDDTEKATLKNLGLGDSIDEISEVLAMSDDEFAQYTKNLETVKGMAEQMADAMDDVTKGSLLTLASAIENVCIAAFNKLKPVIKGAADAVNEFFDTWHNGDKNEFTFTGLEKGLSGLADKVRQQEGNMKQAVVDLFASVNRFINGGSLQSILDMGTSVVQGICKGIMEAKDNGSLDEAIDGAIKNICNWIETNGPAIEEAGKTILDSITDGIKNNEGAITGAMNELCSIMTSWASSSGDLKAAAGLFAEQFVGFAMENMWIKMKNWVKEKFTAFGELFSGPFTAFGSGGLAMNLWTNIMEGIFGVDPIGEMKDWLSKKLGNFHPIQWIKEHLFKKKSSGSGDKEKIKTEDLINLPSLDDIKSYINGKLGSFNVKDFIKGLLIGGATAFGGPAVGAGVAGAIKVADLINIPTLGEIKEYITSKFSGFNIKSFIKTLIMGGATAMGGPGGGAVAGAMLKAADLFGEWNPVEDIKGWLNEKVGDWGITKWFKEKFGNKDGKGEKVKVSDLLELDTEKLADIETQLNSLSTTASTVSTNVVTAFNNITNTARTNFVNMANIVRNQMVNCANIVRNQAVNMANIVRNQALNMSNIFRNQFTSMANIARNQMVNVSNIVRNQAISWSNVIRNQVTNARNTFTSQFLSMAAVARTQMVNISNIVRNQAISWSNVIRNQTANMKASFTAAFSGLSSIAASQMAKCLSTVRSYMSQIRAATAQTMTMNFRVNKTVTTTNVTRSVAQGAARTMSNIARNGSSLIAPQAVAIGGNIVGGSGRANNGLGNTNALQLHIPLTVDGREIARATASYNQEELSKLSKRNNRRRGE